MVRIRGIFYACLSAATFGMIPLFVNRAILAGVNNDTILVYRYTLAAVLYGLFLLCRRTDLRISCRELKEVALAGVGGYGVTAFFLFLSYHYMPTGIATSVHYLYPVVVAVFMALFFRERLTPGGEGGYYAGRLPEWLSCRGPKGRPFDGVGVRVVIYGHLRNLYRGIEPPFVEGDESRCTYLLGAGFNGFVLYCAGGIEGNVAWSE